MALLDFDAKKNPTKAYAGMLGLAALLIVFPFFAAQFGNSWVRIIDMALLYIMLALGLNIVVGEVPGIEPGRHAGRDAHAHVGRIVQAGAQYLVAQALLQRDAHLRVGRAEALQPLGQKADDR